MRYMHLRLKRKPEQTLYGIDLSRTNVGDIMVVTAYSALRLISEGWAVEDVPLAKPERAIYPPSRSAVS